MTIFSAIPSTRRPSCPSCSSCSQTALSGRSRSTAEGCLDTTNAATAAAVRCISLAQRSGRSYGIWRRSSSHYTGETSTAIGDLTSFDCSPIYGCSNSSSSLLLQPRPPPSTPHLRPCSSSHLLLLQQCLDPCSKYSSHCPHLSSREMRPLWVQ